MKVLLALVAALALLAPASVAHAAPTYDLSIDAGVTKLYPVVDGYVDSTVIQGEVDAGAITRIRGTVVVSVGAAVVKTVILSTSGHFEFTWNGRTAKGAILPGTATVTLRVDGQVPVTDTLTVSSKKLVAITMTKTQRASDGIWCFDSFRDPDDSQPLTTEVLCRDSHDSSWNYTHMTMRGTKTTGSLIYIGRFWDYSEVLHTSVLPVKVSVTGSFSQTGTGMSRMWIMPYTDYGYFSAGTNPIKTWTKSSKVTATGHVTIDYAHGTYQPEWVVSVPNTVNLKIAKFTIKVTYYRLK